MKWVPDKSGRFPQRRHYLPSEPDFDCERIVEELLVKRHGVVQFPVLTDDLLFLLEQHASVDQFATLPEEVWGVTDFVSDQQPLVNINPRLSSDARYLNPFRTTLTHEFAHVHFHGFIFGLNNGQGNLFGQGVVKTNSCYRTGIEGPDNYDWIEWQAAYCSGAILMPRNSVRSVTQRFFQLNSIAAPKLASQTLDGQRLMSEISQTFQVSPLAA